MYCHPVLSSAPNVLILQGRVERIGKCYAPGHNYFASRSDCQDDVNRINNGGQWGETTHQPHQVASVLLKHVPGERIGETWTRQKARLLYREYVKKAHVRLRRLFESTEGRCWILLNNDRNLEQWWKFDENRLTRITKRFTLVSHSFCTHIALVFALDMS